MSALVDGLEHCTQYTLEIGAGPNINDNPSQKNSQTYENEDLLNFLNSKWNFDETAFKAYVSTSLVRKGHVYKNKSNKEVHILKDNMWE